MKLIEKIVLDDIVKEIENLKDDFFIVDRKLQYRVTGRTVRVDNGDIRVDVDMKCRMGDECFYLIIYNPTNPDLLEGSQLYASHFHHKDLEYDGYDMAKKLERYIKEKFN